MSRFFISQHPTFGRNTLNIKGIEKSHYYWWWYALHNSKKYISLCEANGAGDTQGDVELTSVYNDFGDVRLKNNESTHEGFKRWWSEKISENETRGEYLFAEKLTGNKVEVITDEFDFREAVDANKVVISIPQNIQRTRIDKAIERILKQRFAFERGRQTRNPKRSTARYYLNKTFDTDVMKLCFACLEERVHAEKIGYKITLYEIAEKIGLKVKSKRTDEFIDEYERQRTEAVKVSKYIKTATQAIIDAENGSFP